MNRTGYTVLGWAVWKGGTWYARRKVAGAKRAAIAAAVVAGVVAVGIAVGRAGDDG